MIKVSLPITVAASLVAALGFTQVAHAQSTVMYNLNGVTNMTTDFSTNIGVQQFDPSLGTLISAQITFTGGVTTNITVTNNGVTSSSGHANTKVTFGLTDPDGILPNPAFTSSGVVNPGGFAVVVTSANDNYTNLAGGASQGPTLKTGTGSVSQTYSSASNAAVLSELTGTGTINFTGSTYAQTTVVDSGGNTSATQSTTGTITGTVVYTYQSAASAAPEPGSIALTLCGVATGIGMVRRRRAL